jgi:hypothetical protein
VLPLVQAEIERSSRKPTANLDAYDHYLRGLAGVHLWTKEGNDDALNNLYRAIELDSLFAAAFGWRREPMSSGGRAVG